MSVLSFECSPLNLGFRIYRHSAHHICSVHICMGSSCSNCCCCTVGPPGGGVCNYLVPPEVRLAYSDSLSHIYVLVSTVFFSLCTGL